MRRRDLIVLVGSGVADRALGARAQEAGKIWRMGFVAHGYETFYAIFTGLRHSARHEEGLETFVRAPVRQGATPEQFRISLRRWFGLTPMSL